MLSPLPVGPLNLPELEQRVIEHWADERIVARVAAHRPDGERWVTYEGPPTVNGSPALHHVWTSVYKDIYARFQIMRGKRVDRRAGWDCQGLPVEIAVERKLGLKDKGDIERFGVAEFVAECRRLVQENIGLFESVLGRAGYWVDYDRAYRTMDDAYLESAWWHLDQMWQKGLVFEGSKVVPYCFRCGTALSSHELGQPGVYADRTDDAAFVALPLTGHDAAIVVWTTTPWTLPANVAVAVHPEYEYGVYPVDGRRLVVAVERAADLVGDVEPVEVLRGADLVGDTYRRPYPDVDASVTGRVVGWDEVALDVGSGAVHIAPAFGEEDAQLGTQEGLAVVNPMDGDGRFTEGPFAGRMVLEAVPDVVADLDARGLLVRQHRHQHSYPHCWRCRTPLVYWAKPTWFVRTSEQAERFVAENEKVTWYPESIKHGRFGNWLRGNVDWAIARDRYWGTPLPVWRCEQGHDTCVGSRRQLSELTGSDLSGASLHRPEVDEITFPCPKCGEGTTRVPYVCDVWLDSGVMPAAQSAYPAGGTAEFEANFPADFVCEAIDQTRGWFYSLLAVNTMVFDSTPYRNVVCLGLLVDDEGRKMSKSVGNVIDPTTVFPTYGADGLRWYLLGSGAPWGSRRVSLDAIDQRRRRDLDTLWNVVSFYRQYAELERFTPAADRVPSRHVLDRWILSRASALITAATDGMENYAGHQVVQAVADFVDELSNWYVRRSRRRFWGTDGSDADAFQTLHHVLSVVTRLLAPFCPHLADGMYHVLGLARDGADSVHLTDWPVAGERDVALEEHMAAGRQVASLVRSVRAGAEIPVRQPLRRAVAAGLPALPPEIHALVVDETNVVRLDVGESSDVPLRYQVQPNWKRLGPRYRSLINGVKAALAALDQQQIAALRTGEPVVLTVEGQEVHIDRDDVTVRESVESGWAAASDSGVVVAIDTTVDDDLRTEFERRQMVRRIQVARRESGLGVSDRLVLWLAPDVMPGGAAIATEVLATEVRPLAEAPPAGAPVHHGEGFAFQKA